jgi:dTDP-4-dehydrorhamnose reductase
MKHLIVGNGFLGQEYSKYFNCYCYTYKIMTQEQMDDLLNYYQPDVVINCAGKTGRPNIDWCESNKEDTFLLM